VPGTGTSFIFVDWEELIFNDRVVLVSGGIFVIVIEEFEADGVLGLFLRTFDGLQLDILEIDGEFIDFEALSLY